MTKPLVVIPARGGSKGVPRKNIKLLAGKPLIHHTIEAAREVFPDEAVCVSTDDAEIKEVAEATGITVPFLRPAELSTDTAGSYEVLLHAIGHYENSGYLPDTLILLQPTSPFRTAHHIREALALYTPNCDMVVSVKATKANPYYVLFEESSEGWLHKSKPGNYTRRQDCPPVWEYNGAIYIMRISTLKQRPINQFDRVKKYVMDEQSSHDIDSMMDWWVGELLLSNTHLREF